MCGLEVTSVQVSRAAQQLDKEIELWRNRALGQTPHLILDARYEKVRVDGQVIDVAVLIGYGVDTNGCRRILGVSVELSEAEVHWRSFLESLVKRGLHGIKLIVSDDHSGLKAARKAVFPSIAWQRCQFHLQQNAQSYIAKKSDKKTIAAEIRAILNSEDLVEAERKLKILIAKYEDKNPRLSEWLEHAIPEGLSVFKMPTIQQKKLRTSNMAERVNQEVKRRTKVARIFPNIESLLRLVSAICMDIDEDWSTQTKRYLTKE
jgi:transposase-like protein